VVAFLGIQHREFHYSKVVANAPIPLTYSKREDDDKNLECFGHSETFFLRRKDVLKNVENI
jgi:hypothetical protein